MKLDDIRVFIETYLIKSKNNNLDSSRSMNGGAWVQKHFPEFFFKILEKTPLLKNHKFSQRIYHIYNYMDKIPVCASCGKEAKFESFKRGYRNFCSVTCATISKETIEKRKETWRKNYGTDYPTQSKEVKEKIKKTCLTKFGVENPYQSEEIKEKSRQTMLKRYGVEHQLKSEEIKEKSRQTCLERYGVEYPIQVESVKEKYKQTCLERYGVDNYFKSDKSLIDRKIKSSEYRRKKLWPNLIESMKERQISLITKLEDFNGDVEFICNNGHKTITYIGNWRRDLKCPKCSLNGKSKPELELYEFVSLYVKAENGTRKIIKPYQIDVYIPEHKLAIEYDGLYWHSELSGSPILYHLNKTNLCREKGVDLIHIFDDEWTYRKEIVKSMLLNKLGKIENKIYARKCTIKEVCYIDKDRFLKENHIQGTCVSSINLGLYHDEELVSVMTFGKRKITGQDPVTELLRFCNKLNISVPGGASKLFKYYVDTYKPEEIVSYADRRLFTGKMYETLGFELDHVSGPNYWYTKNHAHREHRVKYQKHKLPKLLENFDSTKTEWQNMKDHGYDRIWDCGNLVYKWNKGK